MSTAIIIVGMGQWKEYTLPLIESIRHYEKDASVVLVDNGFEYTKSNIGKMSDSLHYLLNSDVTLAPAWDGDYNHNVIIQKPVSYAKAINIGLSLIGRTAYDWYIVMNNDVLCTGPFWDKLCSLDDYNTLYGDLIHHGSPYFKNPSPWVDGWIYYISRNVLINVGLWDEEFKVAGFEDADYCFRAHDLGFKIKYTCLPFSHLKEHSRKRVPGFRDFRYQNFQYLLEKHGLKRIPGQA